MKSRSILILCLCLPVFFMTGCEDEEISNPLEGSYTERLNSFIVKGVNKLYFWTDEINWPAYENAYSTYTDPKGLFGELMYKEDQWSRLTEDIDGLWSAFEGVSTTYGYSLTGGQFSGKESLFAIVLYTYAGSPAEQAGLKRGDIIVQINGRDITKENVNDLYYTSYISLTKGYLEDGFVKAEPASVEMSAVEMYEDPVCKDTIIVKGAHKIGYLCYTGFMSDSEPSLLNVFSEFKSEGVTDVVLDLRYNSGGSAETSRLLGSVLAPSSAVETEQAFLVNKWNAFLSENFSEDDTHEYFKDNLSVNMNLNRLFVLTSGYTASASESIIIGLDPYMDVVTIGDTTAGKYYGGILVRPSFYYKNFEKDITSAYYSDFSNWGMYLMVYRYASSQGYPSFSGGLAPDIRLRESPFDLKPFGNESDPLFSKAIQIITGVSPDDEIRSVKSVPDYRMMPEMKMKRAYEEKFIHKSAMLFSSGE